MCRLVLAPVERRGSSEGRGAERAVRGPKDSAVAAKPVGSAGNCNPSASEGAVVQVAVACRARATKSGDEGVGDFPLTQPAWA